MAGLSVSKYITDFTESFSDLNFGQSPKIFCAHVKRNMLEHLEKGRRFGTEVGSGVNGMCTLG